MTHIETSPQAQNEASCRPEAVELLSKAIMGRAFTIYGRDALSSGLTFWADPSGETYWNAMVCRLRGKTISVRGTTAQESHDAIQKRMELDSLENLSAVLGFNVAA